MFVDADKRNLYAKVRMDHDLFSLYLLAFLSQCSRVCEGLLLVRYVKNARCLIQVLCGNGGEKLLLLAEGLLKKHIASHSLHEPEGAICVSFRPFGLLSEICLVTVVLFLLALHTK